MIKRIIAILLFLTSPVYALDTGWSTIAAGDLITVSMYNSLHQAVDSKLNNDIMVLAGSDGKAILDSGGNYIKWPGSSGGLVSIVGDTTPQLGGDLDLNGFNIDFPTTANISDVLDEDNMVSDSATVLATQQSIKAYVDDNVDLKEDVVTEGSLTDSVIVSADIKDGEITAADLASSLDLSSKTLILPNNVLDFTPDTDDSWQGDEAVVTAGESISHGDVIYTKYDTDGLRAFAYNANSTDSDNDTYRPRGIALEAETAGNAFEIGIGHGIMRNDGWTFSDATDEGKPVFAGETDGAITLTRPSDSGDHIIHLGNICDEDEIEFYFGPITDTVVP